MFHLLTATRPVLLPNNQDLTFAPYNTHYPLLEDHLEQAGLVPHVNVWDQPISLVGVGGEGGAWCFMSPESFYKMDVPFKMEGGTKVYNNIIVCVSCVDSRLTQSLYLISIKRLWMRGTG